MLPFLGKQRKRVSRRRGPPKWAQTLSQRPFGVLPAIRQDLWKEVSQYLCGIFEILSYLCRICMARIEMMVPGWAGAVKQAVVLPPSMYEIAALQLLCGLKFCAFVCDKCYKTFVRGAELRMQGLRPSMYEMIAIGSNLPALRFHFAPNPIRQI